MYLQLNPHVFSKQSQNEQNLTIAENYLFNNKSKPNVVITGSSLAFRLLSDSLPGVTNLSLGGLSIFDGLEIIKQSKLFPKAILVETNIIDRKESINFHSELFKNINYSKKKYLPALRSGKQPLGLTAVKILESVRKITQHEDYEGITKSTPKKLNKNILEKNVVDYNTSPDSLIMERNCKLLLNYADYFQSRNTLIIFFTMPVNNRLSETKKYQFSSKIFREHFPQSRYTYIHDSTWNFNTTDGMHLNIDESARYSSYLSKSIDEILINYH